MIKIRDIYDKTHDGLDVLLHYIPEARVCVDHRDAKFKLRPGERTASASLFEAKGKDGQITWKVIDFGDEGRAMDGLDVCMQREGLPRTYEAVLKLASIFGVKDELDREVNRPRIDRRPTIPSETEGDVLLILAPDVSVRDAAVMGPKVRPTHLEALGWHLAVGVGRVKNGFVTWKYSTDTYPIFVRICRTSFAAGYRPAADGRTVVNTKDAKDVFYKIYEPLNPDKGFRFQYAPRGGKPQRYINGLVELKERYEKENHPDDVDTTGDEYGARPPIKLDAAFICSGERDALCCFSMGGHPVWFNSETYSPDASEIAEIGRYASKVYNIPDIDDTGIKKGRELALKYPEILTIWLPSELREYKDNRGKRRKDLKDWMELRDRKEDFRGLMELALPTKFWSEGRGKQDAAIDTEALLHFLRLNGFYTLRNEHSDDVTYIRINGNMVKIVKARDIKAFVQNWAQKQCLPRAIRNLIHNSPRFLPQTLANLKEVDLDFTNYTPTSQLFFFPGSVVEVTKDAITEHVGGNLEMTHYVLAEDVIPHKYKALPPMFEIRKSLTADGGSNYDVEVLNTTLSPVFGYVINTSRLYWRKEMETRFAASSASERETYCASNRFRIDGEGLSPNEIREQKQNLVNKLFTIGYMLHRYKSPSRAWAPQAMDNKIGEEGECNGRSGKSFLFKALGYFMHPVTLSGRNPKLVENHFFLERVTERTDMLLVDDCSRQFDTGAFYDMITGDMVINPKNNRSFCIPFINSPKIAFTTNYVPKDFSPSTDARLLYMVFSDYYHQKTQDNDYIETRSIRDDFGRDLFTDTYTEEDWNGDANFFMQCVRFYLSVCEMGEKLLPPMKNIEQRKFRSDMGANFQEWAEVYFVEGGDHLDTYVIRREAYEDFVDESKVNRNFYTMNKFTKSLRAFCELCPYIHEYNPDSLKNNAGRIMRRVEGRLEDMIYIRSNKAFYNGEPFNIPTTDIHGNGRGAETLPF